MGRLETNAASQKSCASFFALSSIKQTSGESGSKFCLPFKEKQRVVDVNPMGPWVCCFARVGVACSGDDLENIQRLILMLSEVGSTESLSRATAYLSVLVASSARLGQATKLSSLLLPFILPVCLTNPDMDEKG